MKNKLLILMFSIIGFYLIKCNNQTTRPIISENVPEIPYDSLKTYYNNGAKIVINGWILYGPKDFLDSVSIDKKLFKIKQLNNDSAIIKFGSHESNKIYEVSVPEMDSLPKGEFIDQKLYKYVNQNKGVFLVNGEFFGDYSSFLRRVLNRKIEYVSTISSEASKAIWGDNIGRDGALHVKVNDNSYAQKIFLPFSSNSLGRKLMLIDSSEFFSNKVSPKEINLPTNIAKNNYLIKVPFGDSSIEFKDDTTNENLIEYSVLGENKEDHWILIKGQDYHQDYFYIINQQFKTIDTLVGKPRIFNNKLLCQEGSYTDSPGYLEIWNIKNSKLQLLKKFSLRDFGVYSVDDSFLYNDTLYLRYNQKKYLKLKI
jgi:hypothetical protein